MFTIKLLFLQASFHRCFHIVISFGLQNVVSSVLVPSSIFYNIVYSLTYAVDKVLLNNTKINLLISTDDNDPRVSTTHKSGGAEHWDQVVSVPDSYSGGLCFKYCSGLS
jgi:hypothetical protein